jgi:two-component system chemotaxis sensor kinase CheA
MAGLERLRHCGKVVMNEVIREFLLETHENLAQLDLDFLTLEKDPTERETLARVFRTLHTVKGTAGFLGLLKLQGVTHAGENLLSKLRDGELTFNAPIASVLLATVDAVRQMLGAVEATESDGDGNYSELIHSLERLTENKPLLSAPTMGVTNPSSASLRVSDSLLLPPESSPLMPAAQPPTPPVQTSVPQVPAQPVASPVQPPVPTAPPVQTVAPPQPPAPPPTPVVPSTNPVGAAQQNPAPQAKANGENNSKAVPAPTTPPGATTMNTSTQGLASSLVTSQSVITQKPEPAESGEPRSSTVSDSAIRVDVGLLDKLMTLVGELVLARNQIMQFSTSQEDAPFLGTVQRLNLLTTELQTNVMKTRMQPIGNIWTKFPRVVRDLAVACGKHVRVDMEGQETELDKTIVEAIRDPLTHMVRNAVDHGIETPSERVAVGKPPEGRLILHAFHEGGKVIIEIADDGKGIDPHRVRDKAIASKLITIEQANRLNDRELVNLVFLPGFSTADKITQFSGRGVGMDVVRTHVEKIGGMVNIDSRPTRGTTVRMKIPLTLAIIPALTITAGGDRYAIPQVNLLELVRLEGEQAQRGIELIHGAPVYRLRGNLLPLVYLYKQLQVETLGINGEINIVVLQADDRQFGLVVDAIHDTEEIVVKPLQKQVKGITAFAGATIMGDGKVALILDVLGLAQRANVVSGVRERALNEKASATAEVSADRETVLLFATRQGGRMAIPLKEVARLEEFPRTALERVGTQDVVQYREAILPLIDVSRALRRRRPDKSNRKPKKRADESSAASEQRNTVQVVVYAGKGQRVGLVVANIIDIVEETIVARSRANRPGVLFTAVIQGRVTEFLDLEWIVRSSEFEITPENGSSVEKSLVKV